MSTPESKFTAIYVDTLSVLGAQQSMVCCRRVERNSEESIMDMLHREGIASSVTFLFNGHLNSKGD